MVAPKDIIVTAPKKLWCSKRSKRVRDLAAKHHFGVYVNGIQGDITVTSYGEDYTISTEKKGETRCAKDTNKQVAQQ